MNDLPNQDDLVAARMRLNGVAHRTPVLTSRSLNTLLDAELFFKCENFQRAGAFKFRGASNAVMAADRDALAHGVATHSSGNHAGALALAARAAGIPAVIVMPNDAPEVKKRAVAGYGARIIYCEPNLESRESTLAEAVAREGLHFVHPYDNRDVIAGQATAGLEFIEQVRAQGAPLDTVIAPVGGGGLLGGTALAFAADSPQTAVIGAEPAAADDAWRSLQAGHIIPVGSTDTVADGLRTSLGERNFALLERHQVRIVTAREDEILGAMRLVWERMKIIIEPSAAVPVALLQAHREAIPGRRIGVILSGGNVDLGRLAFS